MSAVLTASIPAIAVAAVVAACGAGAWLVRRSESPGSRPGRLPHLAVGALAGVAALLGARWSGQPVALLVAAAGAVTALVAAGAGWLDGLLHRRRGDTHRTPLAPLLGDLAVLALLVAVSAVARPAFAVDFAASPLGGSPVLVPGLIAAALGVVALAALSSDGARRLPLIARWALVGALVAATALPAAGLLNAARLDPSRIGVPSGVAAAVADPFGLAVRAIAVALAAGRSPLRLLLWALALSGAEAALRRTDASLPILAVVAVLAVGLYSRARVPRTAHA